MKTLKKNNEFKRVPDSTEKHLKAIDKLLKDDWTYCPKRLWKDTFKKKPVVKNIEPQENAIVEKSKKKEKKTKK